MTSIREPFPSPYLVSFDGGFRIAEAPTVPPTGVPDKKHLKAELREVVDELSDLQRVLYAHDHHAVLLIFQAMDAAGKDSTIRNVFSGVNPTGFQVASFKKPSAEELDHDFLWRTARRLPERGRIGVFNRSYYEETLVVKVHPEYLDGQRLPADVDRDAIWEHRYESIRDHEQHLVRNGTAVVKFFLHVSKEAQRRRFLSRLDEPEKNWKFATGDVHERGFWDAYQQAYQDALRATSRPWAPWYAVPADNKPFLRLTVAQIVAGTLRSLGLRYPEPDPDERAHFDEMRRQLETE
ncbi:MAG: polyphosphate kinase 2 family protein [Thermoanaerobaculia bacterium]|nr:polyphosphate kinase 2 family protein [Thermoanaerobaculia bacterium]